ncbi:hypothetical protein TNCV_3600271, partial [Trichonephila clavipes]
VSLVPDYCQFTGTLPPLLDSVVGGGMPERSLLRVYMDQMLLCPAAAVSEPQPPIPVSDVILSSANTIITPAEPSSSIVCASTSDPDVLVPSASTKTLTHYPKQNSKTRARKRKKELPKEQQPEIKINTKPCPTRILSYQDDDMIIYEVDQLEDINRSL